VGNIFRRSVTSSFASFGCVIPFVKREVMPGNLKGRELENFVRDAAMSYWHQTCTAKMGRDSMSAVDSQLRAVSQLLWPDKDGEVWFSLEENHEEAYRSGLHQLRNRSSVYGVDNLRVADGSIMPWVTTGNTMAPCVVIGERAGEILKVCHKL
jgi:choline dehydrogenase